MVHDSFYCGPLKDPFDKNLHDNSPLHHCLCFIEDEILSIYSQKLIYCRHELELITLILCTDFNIGTLTSDHNVIIITHRLHTCMKVQLKLILENFVLNSPLQPN